MQALNYKCLSRNLKKIKYMKLSIFDHYQRSQSVSLKKISVLLLLLGTMATKTKEATLIRDVSWSGCTYFEPNSFYVLIDPIYKDKISLLEEQWGETNFLFSWLGSYIPRSWNINVGKNTTIWSYDALDALYVGIQGASPDITQACVDLLPISKAVVPSGKTTDYRIKEIVVDGKFDLTQFVTLNYECMSAKINKLRVSKALCFATAGAIALGAAKPTFISKLLPSGISLEAGQLVNLLSRKNLTNWMTQKSYLLTAFPLVAAAGAHHIENVFINGFVTNFEIIMNSEKVIFNKDEAREQLTTLVKKVKRFGCNNKYAERLKTLIQKL